MQENPFLGVLLYVVGGLAGASFYLPFKGVRRWAWESYWAVYAVTALLLVPWVLAFTVAPNVLAVLRGTDPKILLWCYVFGAMWGFGGLAWGLAIRYLGVGLGMAICCGLCASFGTLVPPLAEDKFADLLTTSSGIATLIGVIVAVLGIAVTGMAGTSREAELSDEQKKAGVAEFNFVKGLLVAIFSGIMSAGMFFGITYGGPIKELTQKVEPVTATLWQGVPVLVVVLAGGATVNLIWCALLNRTNRTAGDYGNRTTPLARNYLLAALAGTIWYSQFVLLTMGGTHIGKYKFSGWTLLMSSMIIFSTFWGIALREWKGCGRRTKMLLAAGLAILVASVVIIGYGSYLEQIARSAGA